MMYASGRTPGLCGTVKYPLTRFVKTELYLQKNYTYTSNSASGKKKPHFTKKRWYRGLNENKIEARVHTIPDLKDRAFVTLCAPDIIN